MKKTKNETIEYFYNKYHENGLDWITKEQIAKAYDEVEREEDDLNAYMKSRGF